jgi:hypothetical protein
MKDGDDLSRLVVSPSPDCSHVSMGLVMQRNARGRTVRFCCGRIILGLEFMISSNGRVHRKRVDDRRGDDAVWLGCGVRGEW